MEGKKSTKQIAKELGLIRKRSATKGSKNKAINRSCQIFSHLIVIDFESTCWKDSKSQAQEIIEFPAVLMNTKNGKIEAEFHHYVQPQENPTLSDFCKELTGITQEQVEDGIPLSLCLSRFKHWLQSQAQEHKMSYNTSSDACPNLCTIVTWSDWDLGVCLLYECRRKQLRKPPAVNSWIDLRATYRTFYGRKPQGLNGALREVGIEFEGREHSGLHDSRNTARLAWKMICDSCVMQITKALPVNGVQGGSASLNQRLIVAAVCDKKTSATIPKPAVVKNQQGQCVANVRKMQEESEDSTRSEKGSRAVDKAVKRPIGKICDTNHFIERKTFSVVDSSVHTHVSNNATNSTRISASGPNPSHSRFTTPVHCDDDCPVPVKRSSFVSPSTKIRSPLKGAFKNVSNTLKTAAVLHNNIIATKTPTNLPSTNRINQNFLQKSISNFITPRNGYVAPVTSDMKRTPPMCECGKRACRKAVQTPGPNAGRFFFCCPTGKRNNHPGKKAGCHFFKWETPSSSNITPVVSGGRRFSSGLRTPTNNTSWVIPPQPNFQTPQSAKKGNDDKNTCNYGSKPSLKI